MRCLPVGLCVLWAGLGGLLSACEDQPTQPGVDGGVGRALDIVTPPGAQIGLRYGKSIDLKVRYHRSDDAQTPITDGSVRFAIFDDPVGSTLAHDVVATDDQGLAIVTLTAGSQEGSFRIRASADGADDVELDIAISELEFVEIDTLLADPLPAPGGRTLAAALYQDRGCAAIKPEPKPTGAARVLVDGVAASATLAFVNLLSRTYAVTGRVSEGGRLVAFGCLDVDRALVPPGAHLALRVVLRAVQANVIGGFDLDTDVGSSRAARTDGLFADVDVLDRCPGHLGQLLLDELSARVTPARAALIAAHRGPPAPSTAGSSTVDCRPAKLAAANTLDADLGALVAATGAPGDARASLLADLDAILQGARLRSHLQIDAVTPPLTDGPASPLRYAISHQASTVSIALGAASRVDDLAALGLPALRVDGVSAHATGATLTIDPHDLPIALAGRWGDAFSAMSIAIRLPALAPPTWEGWVSAAALAAQRSVKSGCAAIEDLVCQTTDPTACAGTLIAPCTQAVAAVGARLSAPFADSTPLSLEGAAIVVDSDGDLVGDRLNPGQWIASGAIAGQLSFTGQRSTP